MEQGNNQLVELLNKPVGTHEEEILDSYNPPLSHRQYNITEVKMIFGVLLPVSTDVMENAS